MSDHFKGIITGQQREFQRALDGLAMFAKRPRIAMRAIAQELESQTEENFRVQGRPRWKALAAATIEKRLGGNKAYKKNGEMKASAIRALGNMKILQDSGLLAASVNAESGDTWAAIGAARPQARIQQLGGEAGRGHKTTIPARPYLPLTADFKLQPDAETRILRVMMDQLRAAAGA